MDEDEEAANIADPEWVPPTRSEYEGPSADKLLELAGGDMKMVLDTGKQGHELRTILAQRALYVKRKMREEDIRRGKAPPKKVREVIGRDVSLLLIVYSV